MKNTSYSSTMTRAAVVGTILAILTTAPAVRAVPVDCSLASNICTGNPCVTGPMEVLSPCVVDFGAVTLVIDGTLKIPNAGIVHFTADRIEVERKINGKNSSLTDPDAAHVTLIANNDMVINNKIDVSGRHSRGSITLVAGGNIDIDGKLLGQAKGGGATAPAAVVSIIADGTITGTTRSKIKLKGKGRITDGGFVTLSGDTGVAYDARIDVRGLNGGSVAVTASAGNVTLLHNVSGDGLDGIGATITIDASGTVQTRNLDVDGTVQGGIIDVSAGTDVVDTKTLSAQGRGNGSNGGSLNLVAGGDLTMSRAFTRAGDDGGPMTITAGGAIDVRSALTAEGNRANGGSITVTGASVVIGNDVNVLGHDDGGTATIEATAGTLTLEDNVKAEGQTGTGATVILTATGDILLERTIDAEGAVQGGSISVVSTAGSIQFGDSSSDNMIAEGPIGGTIEGSAAVDLTAVGDFTAQTGGCIGLSAGGTLDVSQATFDSPVTGSCP